MRKTRPAVRNPRTELVQELAACVALASTLLTEVECDPFDVLDPLEISLRRATESLASVRSRYVAAVRRRAG